MKHFGHISSVEMINPDSANIATIIEMKPTENGVSQENIPGIEDCLARVIPCLADILLPLRDLLQKD